MSVTINGRNVWGARYAVENYSVPKAEGVTVHHSVTDTLAPNASVNEEIKEMLKLEEIGRKRFGFSISYNVAIFPSGRAYQGVPFNKRGQHTGGMNSKVRSIVFVGNYETHEPTQAQLLTARNIVAEGRGKWWTTDAYVKGHRDVAQTACPGKHVYKHLGYIANGSKPAPAKPIKTKPTPKRVTVNVTMPVLDLSNADDKPVRNRAAHLLQILLVFAGYSVGRAGIDGVAGKMTRVALGNFQIDTKTGTSGKADYVVGAKTWKELIGGWNA